MAHVQRHKSNASPPLERVHILMRVQKEFHLECQSHGAAAGLCSTSSLAEEKRMTALTVMVVEVVVFVVALLQVIY